jgi:5-methyltetrahydrofolate--homocysteine methyltransferase
LAHDALPLDERGAAYLHEASNRVVIFDGAMGTSLQLLGLSAEDFGGPELEGCNEALVLSRPDAVASVHQAFLEVGVDVIETDAFGAFGVVLTEYGLQDQVRDINLAAARIARQAADAASSPERPRWVAGNLGPGTRFPTLGQIPYVALRDSYEEQASALLAGGVDILIIETVFDLLQAKAAMNACTRAMVAAGRRVPLQVQVTIELTGRMLPGTEIGAALAALEAMRPDVIGLNCATGPAEMGEAVRHLSQHCRVPVAVQPNAGLPTVVDGAMHYDLTPEALADHLERFVTELGVNVIGGCCGTTPDHLRAVVERCRDLNPPTRHPEHEPAAASIYSAVPFHQDTSFLVVGERTNANGSKKFREAMLAADWDTTMVVARDQIKEGAHILDVCVDYTGADGVADMFEVVSRFATQASAPLMVDSTEAPVVEAALQWIGGRAVLNSVNLEEGDGAGTRLDRFLTLAREYGAAVVCTCIDTEGQARTAEWKLRAARAIYDIAVGRYGLEPSDLIFDPLVLPLSTGMEESRRDGIETLEGIKLIKSELPGVFTIVGLSNVSFGLNPAARHVLNSMFLHECVQAGLDAAIVHAARILPLSKIDEKVREVCLDLIYDRRREGYDPLSELLTMFEGVTAGTVVAEDRSGWTVERRLEQRIVDGERNDLEADLEEALSGGHTPLAIVNDFLLAGMKTVGELFASGEMQLPFVLQSAETMKAAVSFLEPKMEKVDQGGKATIVLATVKGDVHDIGKNLVDIILTNNGYEVVNLGIKVGIAEMLRAAGEVHPHHAGEPGGAERPGSDPHPRDPRWGRTDPDLRGTRPTPGLRGTCLLRQGRLRGTEHDGPARRAPAQWRGRPHLRARARGPEPAAAQEPDRAAVRGRAPGSFPRGGEGQPCLHPALLGQPRGEGDGLGRHRRLPEPDRPLSQPVGLPPREGRGRRRLQGAGPQRPAAGVRQRQGPGPSDPPGGLGILRRQRRGRRSRALDRRDPPGRTAAFRLPPPEQGTLALHRRLLPARRHR